MMDKNCMNCMRMKPFYDGTRRVGQGCKNVPGMRVNRRMCCEDWRSDDRVRTDGAAPARKEDGHG